MRDAVTIKGLMPASIAVLLVLALVLGWHTWGQHRMRSDSHNARIHLAANYATREVAGIVAARRHGVELFSGEKAAQIANHASDPGSIARHRRLLNSLRRHLPDATEFTITDAQGKTLVRRLDRLIDEVCQADIIAFLKDDSNYRPVIHPHPGAFHFDAMSRWQHRDRKGVFFASFSPRVLVRTLRSYERPGFRLALTLRDQPAEAELDARGTFESRPDMAKLGNKTLERVRERHPVPQTRWDLVVIEDPQVLAGPLRKDALGSALVFVLIVLTGAAMLMYIRSNTQRRHEAELAVSESEERFHALFDNAPDMLFILDPDTRIRDANDLAVTRLGYSREELIGRKFSSLADAADVDKVIEHLADSGSRHESIDYRMVNKGKDAYWVQQRIRALPETTGGSTAKGTQVICRCISDRKLIETTLQTLHQLSSGDSVRFSDRVYRLLHAGTRLLGLELGILSRIEGDDYVVVATVSPDPAIHAGAVLPLSQTFCRDTLKAHQVVSLPDATVYPGKGHPAYVATQLRAYLGIPIRIDGRIYGTLNFSSAVPHDRAFSATELDMVELMAQWVSGELRRQKTEQALAASEQRFRDFAASAADWFWEVDKDLVVTHVSGNLGPLLQSDSSSLQGRPVADLLNDICASSDIDDLEKLLRSGKAFGEFRLPCRIGEREHMLRLSGRPFTDTDGDFIGFRGTGRDVTEEQRQAERVAFAANHDALTGLFNRREFEHKLEQALRRARDEEVDSALCYLDLDRFKLVNDQAGHMAGDALLGEISKVLSQPIRRNDVLARLGGDEFGLLLAGCPLQEAEGIANQLTAAVSEHEFNWRGQSFRIGVSIGVVLLDETTPGLDEALGSADRACYAAKQAGRNQVFVIR